VLSSVSSKKSSHRRMNSYHPNMTSKLADIDDMFSPLDGKDKESTRKEVTMFRIDDNVSNGTYL
jgi:hypothetical protein